MFDGIDLFEMCLESLNEEQRRAKNAAKTEDDVEEIVRSLSKKERKLMGFEKDDQKYKEPEEYKLLVKRFIEKVDGKAVAFFDINEYENGYNVVVATRRGEQYRGKGYALKAIRAGIKWYDRNKRKLHKPLVWWAESDNIGSQKLAERAGFKRDHSIEKEEDESIKGKWFRYIYK